MASFTSYCRLMAIFVAISFSLNIQSCWSYYDSADHIRDRRGVLTTLYYIGSVAKKSSVLRMETAKSWYRYSRHHPDCEVMNIGKKKFKAELVYGTVVHWYPNDPVSSRTLNPGQRTKLSAAGLYAATILQIVNPEEERAIFYGTRGRDPRGLGIPVTQPLIVAIEKGMLNVLEIFVNNQIIGTAYGKAFAAGAAAELLYSAIFPNKNEDPWVKIKSKVEDMIDGAKLVIINAILDNDIKPLKVKIETIVSMIKNPLVHTLYMNFIYELIGYETKFYFTAQGLKNADVNLHILPLYSRTVNMKLGLFTFGLTYKDDLKLTEEEVDFIKTLRQNLIKNGIAHVVRVKNDKLDNDYNRIDPDYFYKELMLARTHAAVHGEEYFTHWKRLINPEGYTKLNDTVVAYSDYFGCSSPNLFREALVNFGQEPLTPRIVEVSPGQVRRLELVGLSVFYFLKTRVGHVICGIFLKFENDVQHLLGNWGVYQKKIELNDRKLEILEVRGSKDVIDCLNFTLSDNSSKVVGHNCKTLRTTFKLKDYYISSLFAAQDNGREDNRIVNIAVSYRLKKGVNETDLVLKPKTE